MEPRMLDLPRQTIQILLTISTLAIAVQPENMLIVRFALHLNQIIGLDERHQVLTTNVFIDQQWIDDNLGWDPEDYNNIKSIRIPANNVWLPDTFIYNNADGGSTGFMKGTYVLVNHNGTILWPVPVKLKSSCKVDITYFPFDDQMCFLKFGSWIYSGDWIDYETMYDDRSIELSTYVNNSEWDLLSVVLEKGFRTQSCCEDLYPDLTYTLYVRRKTFYYIFNIIVPCIMLSILTLLTFWLPPTSGEKITLGLSVFLAFSMFMLLIAEEVPATSEAVPLIGIYLCVVMTLTSVSVIMAVMVINLYNRGAKTRRAPKVVRILALKWISFENDTEIDTRKASFKNRRQTSMRRTRETALSSIHEYTISRQNTIRRRHSSSENPGGEDNDINEITPLNIIEPEAGPEAEVIWLRRDEVYPATSPQTNSFELEVPKPCSHQEHNNTLEASRKAGPKRERFEKRARPKRVKTTAVKPCHISRDFSPKKGDIKSEIYFRKLIVVEWQRIAAVVDRVLFWVYCIGTFVAYLLILVIVPNQNYALWNAKIQPNPNIRSDSRYTM
ncbi:ACH10-like protein [Mya arenaria]|uniref:ACH10-like protein n=1 Tax=Mya arenaria TaxID=6604 RepID=A0ABY7E6Z3_MYAAR|nr:ACH10-like protein [Mya arenaria]